MQNVGSYEDQIHNIISAYCLKQNTHTSNNIQALQYVTIDGIVYIENLDTFSSIARRDVAYILKYIRTRVSLKLYTTVYKGNKVYGFKLTQQTRQKMTQIIHALLNSIKCKSCNSKFTTLEKDTVHCTSCGLRYTNTAC